MRDCAASVVTMVSDVPEVPQRFYVGIDHYRAGRTAGYMLGRLAKGDGAVLIIQAMRGYRAHAERVRGCVEEIATHFPGRRLIVPDEDTLDDAARCYRLVQHALRDGPIAGIYNTGDGGEGIEAALKRAQLLGRVVWAGHEIEDLHRRLLEARLMDVAIDQDPDGQAVTALARLLSMTDDAPPPQLRFNGEFSVYHPTNVRSAPYL
ncbi:substrate-binding domain-containing protein (plasmid) [Paraburkholderia sp. PREW-6R]|uniref:substrate-binding domain-containing protein n=1 Tax=Paraburkholderia sp. PREW-6R TaxID=3141544 RepID=UPI0031F4D966